MQYCRWYRRMECWYQTALGRAVSKQCEKYLDTWLARCGGQFGLSFGAPLPQDCQQKLLNQTHFSYHQVVHHPDCVPAANSACPSLLCPQTELALLDSSVDLAVLAHAFESGVNLNDFVQEVSRVLQPGGHVIVYGFNPWSLWGGIYCILRLFDISPWDNTWIGKSYLQELFLSQGFELRAVESFFYRLPISNQTILDYFSFLERIPNYRVGGVYFMVLRKLSISATSEQVQKKAWFRRKAKPVLQNP